MTKLITEKINLFRPRWFPMKMAKKSASFSSSDNLIYTIVQKKVHVDFFFAIMCELVHFWILLLVILHNGLHNGRKLWKISRGFSIKNQFNGAISHRNVFLTKILLTIRPILLHQSTVGHFANISLIFWAIFGSFKKC